MSIQRFEGATAPDGNGRYVLYADHVAAMQAEAESAHDLGVIYGINHERARIRQAIDEIANDDYCYDYDCRMKAKFLSIIDGEES